MQDTEKLIKKAIDTKIFPGAVLAVFLKGEVVFHRAYGMADIFSGSKMTVKTIFDLASLTKPLATTLCLMLLVQEGRIALGQPIGEIISGLEESGKQKITVRQLLCHTSGMPDWRPWFVQLMQRFYAERKELLHQLLAAEQLCFEPGDKTLYSDLGFMLLEWIIEEVSGRRLDRFVGQAVYKPLGIRDLFYIDLHGEKQDAGEFAATQLCPWRGRLLKGQVDDDNAWAMGGISGQAGLFGTALAVGLLLNRLLKTDGSSPCLFRPRIITRFLQRQSPDGRALGFDVPTRPGSSSGRFFADSSVGHLGFTGTSFWADPDRSLVVALLTNRVHPFRFAGGIKTFRPVLHDTVMKELGLV